MRLVVKNYTITNVITGRQTTREHDITDALLCSVSRPVTPDPLLQVHHHHPTKSLIHDFAMIHPLHMWQGLRHVSRFFASFTLTLSR